MHLSEREYDRLPVHLRSLFSVLPNPGRDEVLAAFPEVHGAGAARQDKLGGTYDGSSGIGFKAIGVGHCGFRIGDSGSAARFFASFPQQNEARCCLCRLLLTQDSGIKQPCNALNVEKSLATPNTQNDDSVRCDAAVSQQPESADKPSPSNMDVCDAERVSEATRLIIGDIVLQNAPPLPLSKIVRNVKSAADLCDLCATAIAQSLVAIRLGRGLASLPLPGSISDLSAQILWHNLALYVADRENTDTILTTQSLKTFFGSVFHAIALNIESEESLKEAPPKFAKRFHYDSKAGADDRLGSKHPTVKPVDLMRWLVRLVTPPGGVVLDMFAGTGTTGEAALREGFRAILIEREAAYRDDIARRMIMVFEPRKARNIAGIKARGLVEDAGPLFASSEAAE